MNEEWGIIFNKIRKNFSAMLGVGLLLFFLLIALLAPVLAPVKIPDNIYLTEVSKLIKADAGKSEIVDGFVEYYQDQYGFYFTHADVIKQLRTQLSDYKKGTLDESVLIATLTKLADDFVIDVYKPDAWTADKKGVIKNTEKEVDGFLKKLSKAGTIEHLINKYKNNGSQNYTAGALKLYKRLHKEHRALMNVDPYLIPNATWNLDPHPPSKKHPFGISNGKDIYYGVIWGTRTSFKIGLSVVLISTLIGLFLGSIAAYNGGWTDEIIMRITDIFLSVPFMLSAIVLTTILGTGINKVMIAMIVFSWMITARLLRGNILQTKNEQYILASKALGVPAWIIVIKHILPNTIFPIIVQASMRIGSIVIIAAALSFLGIGAPKGYADWGSLLSYSRDWIISSDGNPFQYWYLVFYPGFAMVLFVLAWNLVGDALRDIFDPKLGM